MSDATTDGEASPRPWKVFHGPGHVYVESDDGRCVARVGGEHYEREHNAALIVRAVNAHDDLLAACQRVSRLLEEGFCAPSDYMDGGEAWSKACREFRDSWEARELREAIAKAEGR